MIKEIKTLDHIDAGVTFLASNRLFEAAVSGQHVGDGSFKGVPQLTLNDVVSCDRNRLSRLRKEPPHGLFYHWNATAQKGSAVFQRHGQNIEISWWTDDDRQLWVKVRVKNPTLETFMAIPEANLEQMGYSSSSGRHFYGLKIR